MVVNLAHWMRPTSRRRRRLVRTYGLLVRLIGLTLTVLLTAAACEVALDLTAWQCAGTPACSADRAWLGFLATDGAGHGGWWSQPGRRLGLAALAPAALTGLFWYLSHRTWSAYESQQPLPHQQDPKEETHRSALARPGFWYGRRIVARLRAAHTAAGLLPVAAAVGAAAARHDRRPGGPAPLDAIGWALEAALVVGGAVVVWVVCRRQREPARPRARQGPGPAAAPGRARRARPHPALRGLVAPRLAVGGQAAGRRHVRRHRARPSSRRRPRGWSHTPCTAPRPTPAPPSAASRAPRSPCWPARSAR
ncbi:hypothetical protein SALBM135S_09440 [Streptomyces alboniger]